MNQTRPTLFNVDSVQNDRKTMAELAASIDWNYQGFASAEEFLERFVPTRLGCMVMELQLGKMDGLQLQEHLATLSNAPAVIFLSSYGSVATTVRAMRNGAYSVLEKPCDPDELASTIRLSVGIDPNTAETRFSRADCLLRLDSLDSREQEVMTSIVDGKTNKAIARKLGLSHRTVNRIRALVFKKMAVVSAVELARKQQMAELGK